MAREGGTTTRATALWTNERGLDWCSAWNGWQGILAGTGMATC